MKVRLGWSGEIRGNWSKMDIEFEEEDFDLLLAERDMLSMRSHVTPSEKYRLMFTSAEIYVQAHKLSQFPEEFGTAENKQELDNLVSSRDALLKKLKGEEDDKPPF